MQTPWIPLGGLEITVVWSAGCETDNAFALFPTTLPLTNALATVQWSDVEKADERFCGCCGRPCSLLRITSGCGSEVRRVVEVTGRLASCYVSIADRTCACGANPSRRGRRPATRARCASCAENSGSARRNHRRHSDRCRLR